MWHFVATEQSYRPNFNDIIVKLQADNGGMFDYLTGSLGSA